MKIMIKLSAIKSFISKASFEMYKSSPIPFELPATTSLVAPALKASPNAIFKEKRVANFIFGSLIYLKIFFCLN